MRIFVAVVCLIWSALSLEGQTQPQPNSVTQQSQPSAPDGKTKIDPAKEADIRRLLDLTGVKTLVAQMMDGTQANIRPLLANSFPPGEYREKLIDLFFAKFKSKANIQQLLDIAVPFYDKYFSREEIRSLVQFYETPLGQKTISVLPQLSRELQEAGKKWGEEIGRQSMSEVFAEHPELLEAMKAAQKTAPNQ